MPRKSTRIALQGKGRSPSKKPRNSELYTKTKKPKSVKENQADKTPAKDVMIIPCFWNDVLIYDKKDEIARVNWENLNSNFYEIHTRMKDVPHLHKTELFKIDNLLNNLKQSDQNPLSPAHYSGKKCFTEFSNHSTQTDTLMENDDSNNKSTLFKDKELLNILFIRRDNYHLNPNERVKGY